jgi:hypothetical protein
VCQQNALRYDLVVVSSALIGLGVVSAEDFERITGRLLAVALVSKRGTLLLNIIPGNCTWCGSRIVFAGLLSVSDGLSDGLGERSLLHNERVEKFRVEFRCFGHDLHSGHKRSARQNCK